MEKEIIANKKLRSALDKQLQELRGLEHSKGRSLASTKIQEAIMWLGIDLNRLNHTQKTMTRNTNITPTADELKK